jgi:tetratricopeptide (TPR) repeat protein
MTVKEKVTLGISLFAIILSITATFRGEIRADFEADRTIRSQLTFVLESMMQANLDGVKIGSEPATASNDNYIQTSLNILNQRNASLLSQAMYLSNQIPELVTPVELVTIAHAQLQIGNLILAEEYYSKAVDLSKSDYDTISSLRIRGNYFFINHRFQEGRNDYKKALGLFSANNDMSSWTHGTTYLRWANDEKFIGGSESRAEPLYESAKNELIKIDNQNLKKTEFIFC